MIGVFIFAITTILNMIIKANPIITISTMIISIILTLSLFLFSKKGLYKTSRLITFTTLLAFAPIFWKFDGGMQETVTYYILSYITIVVILLSGKEQAVFLTLSTGMIFTLLILEILHPEYVNSGSSRYYALINNTVGAGVVGFIIIILFSIFLSNYKKIKEDMEIYNKKLFEANKKLEYLSKRDPLTGLSNRRDMLEKIKLEIERVKRENNTFSLIMGDIDNFKKINDTYGHECGDLVLRRVSEIMLAELRSYDIPARWGGEEFLILLPDTYEKEAYTIAERLRGIIAEDFLLYNNRPVSYSITFGIIEFSDCSDPIERYIKKVDIALYKGKKEGKNRTILYSESLEKR